MEKIDIRGGLFQGDSAKRYLYLSLTLLTLLLSVFVIVAVVGGTKWVNNIVKSTRGENTITVQGSAELFSVPDIATISFSVNVEKSTVEAAQEEAAEKINAAIAYLEDKDIDKKDIKTTNYSVYPKYEYKQEEIRCLSFPCPQPPRKQELVGYIVNQSITVKIRNTDKVGEILGGIGGLGVTNINGPYFEIDEREKLELQVKKEAIENAKKKAGELADSLGVRLGRIISFNEGGAYPIYYRGDVSIESAGIGGGSEIIPEIPIGENLITSNVTITYEIR